MCTIEVIGKRWAWDFNYVDDRRLQRGCSGQTSTPTAPSTSTTFRTLCLPVDKKVEIKIESRDVIHSFWVVDFLYKKDMIPGKSNYMYFIPDQGGHVPGQVRRAVR